MKMLSPDGIEQPEYILDYVAAYKAANPGIKVPQIWDKRNGWVHYFQHGASTSFRPSQIRRMAKELWRRHQNEKV